MLQPEDDAATANLGNNYRTPTKEEWEELLAKCTWEVATTTYKNNTVINYWKVVGPNGNFIILPSSGWYDGDVWKDNVSAYQSASLKNTSLAYFIRWFNNEIYTTMPGWIDANPEKGYLVRPVFEKK